MTINYVSLFSGIEAFSVAASRIEGVRWNPVFFSEIELFPCAVLAHHFPAVPNLGDICKIRVEGNNVTNGDVTIPLPERGIDILAGGSPCFVAGTMVLTPKGYVPIETLRVGDDVVGGSGVIRKVEAVGSRMAEVGKVKVLGRPEITCTPNHPFMCISMKRDNRRKSPTYARKIPDGDYMATRADESIGKLVGRVMVEFQPEPPFPKCFNASFTDIMELAGWYLGDGYIRRFAGKAKKTVIFALCSQGKIEKFKERFGGIVNFCASKDGKIAVNCTALADWLSENFGEHATDKQIPYWCYTPLRSKPLVAGYFATDGCHCSGATKFVTVSKALAYGIADILVDASVHVCHVPPKGSICGRIVNQHDWYSVVKADNGGIRTRKVKGRYASIVRSYESTGTVQRVYNITVADEHTYIAEGLWTHNCQDVSVAGKRAGMSEGSGTRSSLAFEYARLVEELHPRVVAWENVPGVLSSNGGRDFLAFQRSLVERGYSLAWRVLDAQYARVDGYPLAVPQRRKRVWLVGCLGTDESVPAQILFERPGLLGDSPPRRAQGQGSASPPGYRAQEHDRVVGCAGARVSGFGKYEIDNCAASLRRKSGDCGDGSETLAVIQKGNGQPIVTIGFCPEESAKTRSIGAHDETSPTLNSSSIRATAIGFKPGQSGREDTGSLGARMEGVGVAIGVAVGFSHVASGAMLDCQPKPCAVPLKRSPGGEGAIAVGIDQYNAAISDSSATLGVNCGISTGRNGVVTMLKVRCGKDTYIKPDGSIGTAGKGPLASEECAFTISATQDKTLILNYIARRLTPVECERLQGFPDGWTRIPWRIYQESVRKKISYERLLAEHGKRLREPTAEECPDSPRYKALGNSWATNCAEWVLRRIVAAIRLGMVPYGETKT